MRRADAYGEVLYDLPKAQQAFIYNPSKENKPEIALLIVDIADWDNRVRWNLVRPIELPNKGYINVFPIYFKDWM